MKRCPLCQARTIPYKWVFFGISKHKNGRCFQCTHCGTNIKKSRWVIFDFLFLNEWTLGILLLLSLVIFDQVFHNVVAVIFSTILFFTAYCMLIEYLSPLQKAEESYCRGDLSKVGALFALIAIPTIIIFTIYTLYKMS